MNIGILEYDEKIAYQLEEIAREQCPHGQVKVCTNSLALKEEIKEGAISKILILSLEQNPNDIIDYAVRLQDLYPDVKLIYTSQLDPVMFEVYRSVPTYVLSKPLQQDHVKASLKRALKELSLSRDKNFTIINKQGIFTVPYKKIYYVESDKRKLNIYGEEGLIKSINLKISDFLKFEHGKYFLQCHKSYAVNLMHISQMEKYEILLENGMELPVSQSRYMETRSGYVSFLENE